MEGLLNQKSTNPFDKDLIDMLQEPKDFEKEINENISLLNEVIDKHNQQVIGHNDEVAASKEKLELHTIAKAIVDNTISNI